MIPRPPLTLLYCPADRPDRAAKALASAADEVIIDLEDAVAPQAKDAARANLAPILDQGLEEGSGQGLVQGSGQVLGARRPQRAVQVRINAPTSPWFEADLAAVASLAPHVAVRIPKAESAGVVKNIAAALPGRELHLLIESALGVERAYELATCHPQVAGISLGEADLKSELSVDDDAGLAWVRSRIVVAARAAGLGAPVMSAFTNIRDLEALRESCLHGKSLGFLGRTAIHPAQLDVIREAFLPTEQEVSQAQETLSAMQGAFDAGAGVVALPNGRFLDAAMIQRARTVMSLVEGDPPGADPTDGGAAVNLSATLLLVLIDNKGVQ